MGIYISENGDWGDIDSLTFLEDVELSDEDIEVLNSLSWSGINDYASDAQNEAGLTPTKWLRRQK